MTEEITDIDLSSWFSTYGLLTSQRILERFKINLTNDELIDATKNPESVHFQLLRIPLKNLFNGIILQQAHDYQVYAQKIFIDYLLSGEASKEATSPGANTREDLEQVRLQLITVGESFQQQESANQDLIYQSQASLINLTSTLNTLSDPRADIDVILSTYFEQTEIMEINLRSFRSQFYDIILKATELIKLLPEYPIDKAKDEENRSSLYFDAHIGEE